MKYWCMDMKKHQIFSIIRLPHPLNNTKKGANPMIYQNTPIENTQNKFSLALKELNIAKLLRKSNITKNCGVSAFTVFHFLLLLVFQGKNLFRFLQSKHKEQIVSKNTYYRFLNESSYN